MKPASNSYLTSPEALQDLQNLNARFIENFVTNAVAAHNAMLHDRFIYVNDQGARIDRATYLKQWATGFDPSVIVYWDTRDELITLAGATALVRATNRYVIRHPTHDEIGMAAYTDTYVFEKGEWKCIQAQITPVAPGNEPGDHTIVSVYFNGIKQDRTQAA